MEGQHEALTKKAIEAALGGDMVALRLCLERLAPPRKDSPIAINLPTIAKVSDTAEASAAVLSAVGAGEITPSEAGAIMALLTAHKSIVETAELEGRIAALEATAAMPPGDTP